MIYINKKNLNIHLLFFLTYFFIYPTETYFAQLAGAVEYTDCRGVRLPHHHQQVS